MPGIFRRARKIDETEKRAKIVDRMMEQGRKLFSRSDCPRRSNRRSSILRERGNDRKLPFPTGLDFTPPKPRGLLPVQGQL